MSSAPERLGLTSVVVTGMSATTAFGRGCGPLLDAMSSGQSCFGPAARFDTKRCRARVAAELPGDPKLGVELSAVIAQACAQAGLDQAEWAKSGRP